MQVNAGKQEQQNIHRKGSETPELTAVEEAQSAVGTPEHVVRVVEVGSEQVQIGGVAERRPLGQLQLTARVQPPPLCQKMAGGDNRGERHSERCSHAGQTRAISFAEYIATCSLLSKTI